MARPLARLALLGLASAVDYPFVTQNVKLFAADGATNDLFGYSVASTGPSGLAVGAPQAAGGGMQRGTVYVFSLSDDGELDVHAACVRGYLSTIADCK